MDMKTMQKTVEKLTLREPMTIDELRTLLGEKWTGPGNYQFKKGLFGKSIQFDTIMQIQPRVSIKENVVTIRKIKSSTKVGIGGGPMIDYKDAKQRKDAAKEGGLKAAMFGGHENFQAVCEKIKELLADRIA